MNWTSDTLVLTILILHYGSLASATRSCLKSVEALSISDRDLIIRGRFEHFVEVFECFRHLV